ncbi:hypothetical protein DFP72DRAFT_1180392 [Ephemerocybe angulata]|uniref:HNH nuclease domain-containing protein n=1 Tax=Ephemerocybe angulata TaxID=980116 RepID=A0A8H6H8M1_9AGAR|nr:hypothetical protein DFP72DRAFT_1180392 [Tulosesus angulatus]
MPSIKPISEGSKIRAQKADPNGMRCLVENCPKERGVEAVHVVPREMSADRKFMKSIEWSWKMRKGTLNLDTRRNVFFLGASLQSLYKSGLWALIPEERIVDRFLSKPKGRFPGSPLPRQRFPDLEDETFRYTFIPLADLSSFGITRQNQGTNLADPVAFTTHLHPFTTLPSFTSHVHPKYVILRMACLLSSLEKQTDPFIINLLETNPVVCKLADFYPAWASGCLPIGAKADPSFLNVVPHEEEDGEEEERAYMSMESQSDYEEPDTESSDGDSVCTAPRRIWYPPSSWIKVARGAKRHSSEIEHSCSPSEHKGKHRKLLEDENNTGSVPWSSCTKESISKWAYECST